MKKIFRFLSLNKKGQFDPFLRGSKGEPVGSRDPGPMSPSTGGQPISPLGGGGRPRGGGRRRSRDPEPGSGTSKPEPQPEPQPEIIDTSSQQRMSRLRAEQNQSNFFDRFRPSDSPQGFIPGQFSAAVGFQSDLPGRNQKSVIEEAREGALFGLPSLGRVQDVIARREISRRESEFLSSDPNILRARALRGDPGFSGMSTEQGEVITFNPTEGLNVPGSRDIFLREGIGRELTDEERGLILGGSITTFGTRAFSDITLAGGGLLNEPATNVKIPFTNIETPIKTFKPSSRLSRRLESEPGDVIQTTLGVGLAGAGIVAGGAGVFSGIRSGGIRGGALSIAEFGAPVRVRPGNFRLDPTQELIQGNILDVGTQGGRRTKFFQGRGREFDDIQVDAVGFDLDTPTPTSVAVTRTQFPTANIRRSGRVDFGVEEDVSLGFSQQVGKEFPSTGIASGRGGRIDTGIEFPSTRNVETNILREGVFVRDRAFFGERQLAKVEAPGGTSEDFFFGAGDFLITDVARKGRGGPALDGFAAQITGTGRRVTLSSPSDDLGFSFIQGRGGTGNILGTKQDTSTSLFGAQIQKSLTGISPRSVPSTREFPTIVGGTGARGGFAGQGLFERTDSVLAFGNLQRDIPKISQAPSFTTNIPRGNFLDLGLELDRDIQKPGVTSRNRRRQRLAETEIQTPIFRDLLGTGFSTKTSQRQIPVLKTGLRFETPFPENPLRGFDFGFRGRGFRPGRGGNFGVFLPGLGFDEKPRRTPKGKRKFRRDPSLISLDLGIFSEGMIEGEKTGLISRPIIRKRKRKKR